MANLILLNGRAVDTNLSIVTDATAYFFSAGSTTPLIVYTDSGLGTPRGSSVAADAEGILPQCWTDQIDVKVDVRDGSGNSLPGFPQDNFPTLPETGSAGTDITMTPVTGNGGTNAQDFGANNVARLNTFDNAAGLPVATGSGGSFAIATSYTITAYAARQEFEFVANHASVGSGSDSLNVDGVGVAVLKKYNESGAKSDLVANDIVSGQTVRVKYDGSHFVVASHLLAGEVVPGIVEAATTAEMTAGTAGKFPPADVVRAAIDATSALVETEQDTTSGTEADWTSLPSTAKRIVVSFQGVSLSGTDNILVQIGDSGGFETTGYASGSGHDTANISSTSGFIVFASSRTLDGMLVLDATGSNRWFSSHGGVASGLPCAGGGSKTLSGTLTQVRVTRTGSNTFSTGTINVKTE